MGPREEGMEGPTDDKEERDDWSWMVDKEKERLGFVFNVEDLFENSFKDILLKRKEIWNEIWVRVCCKKQ